MIFRAHREVEPFGDIGFVDARPDGDHAAATHTFGEGRASLLHVRIKRVPARDLPVGIERRPAALGETAVLEIEVIMTGIPEPPTVVSPVASSIFCGGTSTGPKLAGVG